MLTTLHFSSSTSSSSSMANASPFSPSFPRNYLLNPIPPSSRTLLTSPKPPPHTSFHHSVNVVLGHNYHSALRRCRRRTLTCRAEVSSSSSSVAETSSSSSSSESWVPVVPLAALPKGERRVIVQDGETILLLWYKDEVFAIENRSPAEGAYSEGLLNAKLTQDGCIVCPSTDSTFDLRTGAIKDWYPKNPVLRALTPALRTLYVYPAKTDEKNIYISLGPDTMNADAAAEIVFSGKAQPGVTASDVNVDEVKMVVDEGLEGGAFGFTRRNEIINGKAATIGFLLLLDFELLTGKGLLKGTGFLDFIYSFSNGP